MFITWEFWCHISNLFISIIIQEHEEISIIIETIPMIIPAVQ